MTDLDTRADDVPMEPDHNAYLGTDPFIDDDSWAEPRPSADRRLVGTAMFLGIVLLATGGFIAGAKVQKSRGSSSAANPFAAFANRAGGFGGFGRGATGTGATGTGTGTGGTGLAANDPLAALLGGGAGGSSAADAGAAGAAGTGGTAGTAGAAPIQGKVTKVDGSTITVTKDDGTVITVTLGAGTSIGRRATITPDAVAVGDSISVSGTEASGAVTADAVTVGDLETPPTTPAPAAPASPSAPTTTAPADLGGLLPG